MYNNFSVFADSNCDAWIPLESLVLPVSVIFVLIIVMVAYTRYTNFKIHSLVRMRSFLLDLLICDTILSVAITLWIIFGDEAFNCKSSVLDVSVSVVNGVYYACLFCYFMPTAFDPSLRIVKLCLRWLLWSLFVVVQIALSLAAYFVSDRNREIVSVVMFCYEVRRQSKTVASFAFGFILLMLSDVMLLKKFHNSRNENSKRRNLLNTFCGILFQVFPSLYLIALSFVLFAEHQNSCVQHAAMLVLLALFPAILSTVMSLVGVINAIKERRRQIRYDNRTIAKIGDLTLTELT